MRQRVLSPEAREYIENAIHDNGKITTEEVMALVEEHFSFDPQSAREQQIRRTAHRIMASIRNDQRERTCFAVDDDGTSTYIDVEASRNLRDIEKVRTQLGYKFDGLNRSLCKVNRRRKEVQGQLAMFDDEQQSQELR